MWHLYKKHIYNNIQKTRELFIDINYKTNLFYLIYGGLISETCLPISTMNMRLVPFKWKRGLLEALNNNL
jgi:hypothetical protein